MTEQAPEFEPVDKARLFKPRISEDVVQDVAGGSVRVRGLSRIEVLLVQQAEGTTAQERRMLRYGMVAPKITEAEAERWQKASPGGLHGEIERVTERIGRLSGMTPAAEKDAYRTFRDGPDDGARVLPSGQAGDDGRPSAPDDEQ